MVMIQKSVGVRAKHWCFTLNNYTDDDVARIQADGQQSIQYLVFCKAVGESGTPYLRGYVCFKDRKRLSQCVSIIGQAHFTGTRMIAQSIERCKRDGDFFELGDVPAVTTQGKRSDLEGVKGQGMKSKKLIRTVNPEVFFCARSIASLERKVEELQQQLEHERKEHARAIQIERERTKEGCQELLQSICETSLTSFEDAVRGHMEAVTNNVTMNNDTDQTRLSRLNDENNRETSNTVPSLLSSKHTTSSPLKKSPSGKATRVKFAHAASERELCNSREGQNLSNCLSKSTV